MERRDEKDPLARLALALLVSLVTRATPAVGQARLAATDAPGRSLASRGVAAAVRDAASKLDKADCREVFEDFHDAAGHTMGQNLAAAGSTPQEYLGLMMFFEGRGYDRCESRATLASTSVGSRAIFICSPQFLEVQRSDPGHAAALIIHEELHSLGLGENPPSSKEITAHVIARCGR